MSGIPSNEETVNLVSLITGTTAPVFVYSGDEKQGFFYLRYNSVRELVAIAVSLPAIEAQLDTEIAEALGGYVDPDQYKLVLKALTTVEEIVENSEQPDDDDDEDEDDEEDEEDEDAECCVSVDAERSY